MESPPRATEEVLHAAHRALSTVVRPGDVAVDATLGNGHDTAYLAEQVGPDGCVVGFDVQAQAIKQTRRRLEASGHADRAVLLHAGHETMRQSVPSVLEARGASDAPVTAVCFNLGYLPRGDKTTVTTPATTLQGLEDAVDLLVPHGVVTVVGYRGHAGGEAECDAVLAWAAGLPNDAFHATHLRFVNRPGSSELFVIERRR